MFLSLRRNIIEYVIDRLEMMSMRLGLVSARLGDKRGIIRVCGTVAVTPRAQASQHGNTALRSRYTDVTMG